MQNKLQFRRWISGVFLLCAGLLAGYGLVFAAQPVAQARGEARSQELVCLLLIGLLGCMYWLCQGHRGRAPQLGWGLDWMVLLPPVYAFCQAVPLPLGVIRLLSPERARLVDGLGAVMTPPQWAPLSVTPTATLFHCLLFTGCVVLFLVIYNLAAALSGRSWAIVLPLVVLGALEGLLGLAQLEANPAGVATGTYSIRNHYAGLLEMILPFAVVYPFAVLGRRRRGRADGIGSSLLACLGWGVATVIAAGILLSLSRMGFLAMTGAMIFLALVGLLRSHTWRRNAVVLGAVFIGSLAVLVLLPPVRLILRFEEVDKEGEGRGIVWRASLPLVAKYPLFGCGLGGYGSAFVAFKTSGATLIQDYAHNDYVQYAAELGLVGLAAFWAPIVIILSRLRRAWQDWPHDMRWLALACAGSAVAIGLHSFADFNLYVPANMLVFAWILGVAAHAGHPQQRAELLPGEEASLEPGSEE